MQQERGTNSLSRSLPNQIGSVDPNALKIPARRAESSTTQTASGHAGTVHLTHRFCRGGLFKFGVLETRIGNAKDELQEQISGLKYAKEIDELRARVVTLEEKLGMKPSRRAA